MPASFVAQVTNRSPVAAQVVSVLVHRGIAAVNSTDTNAGDSAGSPVVFVNGGDGVYNVFVTSSRTRRRELHDHVPLHDRGRRWRYPHGHHYRIQAESVT